uniref:Uncharacterized protein n=1 Tax=Sphaerodactylus townsendi TaxID=933632 RepID=A0ACB8F5Q4_9SAUR
MPKRREALLSSEEDSEGSCECSQPGASSAGGPQKEAAVASPAGKMQTGGSQATELLRPKEGACKTASSHGDPLRSSPPYSGVPSLGFSVATSQNEETREAPLELQEGGSQRFKRDTFRRFPTGNQGLTLEQERIPIQVARNQLLDRYNQG